MKNYLFVVSLLAAVSTSFASVAGMDVASSYNSGNWVDGSNFGTGFLPWHLYTVNGGGRFIWSSTEHGGGDVNTAGMAFGLWGNPAGNYSYAQRFFLGGGLEAGNAFSMDIAPSTQSGMRGVSLLDAATNTLWSLHAGSNTYVAGSTPLGWAYAQNSMFHLSAMQQAGNQVQVTLSRGAQSHSATVPGTLAGFVAFNGNNPPGGANNFYFNNLLLTGEPPAFGAMTIGPGPAIGTDVRGTTWYQELQEWEARDVRALDAADDGYLFHTPADMGRDLVAFYFRDEPDDDRLFFRVDLFELKGGWENNEINLYLAIDCAPGGQEWFPDFTDTRTDHPWEACVAVYNSMAGTMFDADFAMHPNAYLGSYWQTTLDAVEFGIQRSFLVDRGWDGSAASLRFQVFTTRPDTDLPGRSDIVDTIGGTLVPDSGAPAETGLLQGAIPGDAQAGRAKYAVISHANQSVNHQSGTMRHIYTDRSDINLHPGFIRLLDSAEMFGIPINLHLSGSLLVSLLWAEQNPDDADYPARDGPTFIARVRDYVTGDGPGSLIGGVFAEHIMPYFEGDVNAKSIEQKSEIIEHLFGLTEADMKVMHIPERVIRSDIFSPVVSPEGPLTGRTFEEIENSGFVAAYVDEVSHLHWWFYPDEQAGWNTPCTCSQWAGWMGCEDEAYHHKIHKINGVYTFMINDREDKPKFGNEDGGLMLDTRRTLLGKARSADQSQVTIVFDDWEAYAGNSFASPDPNHNADQLHRHLRWVANRPWIELVNLRDIVDRIDDDPTWVIDHGYRYDLSNQTYEWLKRAAEHNYDNWYYGSAMEESFFARVPSVGRDAGGEWSPPGMKSYGDMNTPGTLIRDTWDRIQTIDSPRLRKLAELAFSAMIYETAWHDEDANPDLYQSRNYQVTFNRNDACTTSFEDTTWDPIAGWAKRLHGHIRHAGALKDADNWLADIRSGVQGRATRVFARDTDDDTLDEYILQNDRVCLYVERWGARLVRAFVYDPDLDDAIMVIGAPLSNPSNEHENEDANGNRCTAFRDHWSTGLETHNFIDMDFGLTPPVAGSDSWTFVSSDGRIEKKITLQSGRDVAIADYSLAPEVGTLYTRFGFGPNQLDLIFNGASHLQRHSDPTFRGLRNEQGGGVYVVPGPNTAAIAGTILNAGWDNRELALTEQFEVYNTAPTYSMALAFSLDAAMDIDGDGLSNLDELAMETDPWNPDTDGDGIPDGWEATFGLDPLVADAHLPSSTPGYSNLDKYVMNADPKDPNDFLRIEELERLPDGIRVRYNVSGPRRYQIFFADGDESLWDWQPFASTDIPVGTWLETDPAATSHTFVDDFGPDTTGAAPANVRAYKIRVSLPD